MKIGILDYEAGNLKSVETALACLGADYFSDNDPDKLMKADKIIFPGVGEADQAMRTLKKYKLDSFLHDFTRKGNPILGICLGYQILLDHSEESDTECVGLIPGKVVRFPENLKLKVPHMGWNTVEFLKNPVLFRDIPEQTSFYFVHSYFADLIGTDYALTATEYGIRFSSGIISGNIAAFQFHPEKSGKFGLMLLDNFINRFG
jgi:imidazole glycerol-phosphate synthase subunit HisH